MNDNRNKITSIVLRRSLPLFLLMMVIAISSGQAQNKPKSQTGTRIDRIMNVYVKRIQMTKEQEMKFRPVMEQHLANQQAIRSKYKNNRAEMRKEMMTERANMENKLSEIVTMEQMKKYHEWQKSYKSKTNKKKSKVKTPETKTLP